MWAAVALILAAATPTLLVLTTVLPAHAQRYGPAPFRNSGSRYWADELPDQPYDPLTREDALQYQSDGALYDANDSPYLDELEYGGSELYRPRLSDALLADLLQLLPEREDSTEDGGSFPPPVGARVSRQFARFSDDPTPWAPRRGQGYPTAGERRDTVETAARQTADGDPAPLTDGPPTPQKSREYKPSDFFGPPSSYHRLPEDVSDTPPAATRPKRPVSPGVAPGPLRSATEQRPVHHIIAADSPVAAGGRPAAPSGRGPAAPSERGQLPHVAALEQEIVNEGRSSDSFFIATVVGLSVLAVCITIVGGLCYRQLQRRRRVDSDSEPPCYGVTGPHKDAASNADRKMAQSAQMYHYQHQKQRMMAIHEGRELGQNGDSRSEGSDDENEESDRTVYECPGLASSSEMEVKNPLFHGVETPRQSVDDPVP